VGATASLILLIARLGQGLAHGGELPSAQTYVAESAPAERRGLWSSLIYVSGTLGIMVGTALGATLSTLLQSDEISSWGWRVPFLLGGVLGLYTLFMRRRMPETEVFKGTASKDGQAEGPRVWKAIAAHRKQAFQVVGMTVGFTVVYWAWGVSTPTYAISTYHLNASHALWGGVIANAVFVAALPLWGRLSDRIGRKPVLLIGTVGMALLFVPLRALLGRHVWQLILAMSIGMIFIAAIAAIVPAVYAELFPTQIRTVGVGVPYAICVAAFGGTAPYLQTWIGARFGADYFTGYVVALLLISAAVMATLPETRATPLN
jgi:MHS family alpha-ketoglutarate permease-like MFS transporter